MALRLARSSYTSMGVCPDMNEPEVLIRPCTQLVIRDSFPNQAIDVFADKPQRFATPIAVCRCLLRLKTTCTTSRIELTRSSVPLAMSSSNRVSSLVRGIHRAQRTEAAFLVLLATAAWTAVISPNLLFDYSEGDTYLFARSGDDYSKFADRGLRR